MPQALRKFGRFALYVLAVSFAAILLFLLGALIGSSIARNSDWQAAPASAAGTVPIIIQNNGIHTDIVVPIVTPQKDWREDFPTAALPADQQSRSFTHIAIGWGEREVFLETPEIKDVSPLTVLRAITFGGDALIHVSYIDRPALGPDRRVIYMSANEYAALVTEIERSIIARGNRRAHPGYGPRDVFYDARGRYHLGNGCNQWVSDRLAGAGIIAGLWTPLPAGVMRWANDWEGKK